MNYYVSEFDSAWKAGNRCGPAALASVLLSRGWQSDGFALELELTHEVNDNTGDTLPNGSTVVDLIRVCGVKNLPAVAWFKQQEAIDALQAGKQVLALLDNWKLSPRSYPAGPNWDALHWIRLVGVVADGTWLVVDPLCYINGETGTYQGVTVATMDSVWEGILATPVAESGVIVG